MKLTKSQLRRIIKEEIDNLTTEQGAEEVLDVVKKLQEDSDWSAEVEKWKENHWWVKSNVGEMRSIKKKSNTRPPGWQDSWMKSLNGEFSTNLTGGK
jgi:uncharacterized protein HemX